MTTTTTTAPITLSLGTTPEGHDVLWHLTDENGRPQHGLIVGPTASGGTTALVRLCQSAHTAGLYPLFVDLDQGLMRHAWGELLPSEWWTTPQDLTEGLAWAGTASGQDEPHLVFLVDGGRALATDPTGWQRLLRRAEDLRASVVVRAHSLTAHHLGDPVLRDRLLADGQYLALGRLNALTRALARTELDGYTDLAPTDRTRPGQGVYGHRGRTVPVTVTP